MKKRICVDVDGVLADLIGSWINKYNNMYNDDLKPSDITSWDFHDKVKCGKKIYSLLTPDIFESLEVIEDSQRVMEKLNQLYDVWIVTAAKKAEVIPAKSRWIKKHFGFIDKEQIVYVPRKSICRAEWMVDDRPANLETFVGTGLLFNAHHNHDETRFLRMNNWKEIEAYFDDRYEGEK